MAVPKLRFKGFISDWDSRKFSDTLSFLGTNSFSRDNMNLVSGSVKNIHYGDILVIYGNVLDTSCEQIPFVNEDVNISKIKEKDYLLSGDVIIADTAEDYTVGKATEIINSKGIKIIAGLHTQACRPKRKFAVGYLGNFVNSLAFRKQIRRIAQGTKVLSIIKKYIEDMEIHFPIEKEQQKISDFLTTFDKRIIAQQNIVADLEETKKGLLQKIFSQEIRFKDDNGQDYPKWETHRLSDYAEYVSSTACCEAPCYLGTEDMISNFGGVNIKKSQGNYSGYRFGKNDIILGNIRPYLKKCWISDRQGICSTDLLVMNVKGIYPEILFMKMCTDEFVIYNMKGAKGTKMPRGDKKHIMNWTFRLPENGAEQQKIADFLSTFDKKITAEKQVLSDLQEMKKGLLQQMFV